MQIWQQSPIILLKLKVTLPLAVQPGRPRCSGHAAHDDSADKSTGCRIHCRAHVTAEPLFCGAGVLATIACIAQSQTQRYIWTGCCLHHRHGSIRSSKP